MIRNRIVGRGSVLAGRSLSQDKLRKEIDGERRALGQPTSKGEKAMASRRSTEEFTAQLPRMQFNRALGHIIDGEATSEDISYVLKHIGDYERPIGINRTNGNNGPEIAIFDLLNNRRP